MSAALCFEVAAGELAAATRLRQARPLRVCICFELYGEENLCVMVIVVHLGCIAAAGLSVNCKRLSCGGLLLYDVVYCFAV